MSILSQLGVNDSFIYQFIIFGFIFSFLAIYVFSPYTQAYAQREHNTKGGEELANELQQQAQALRSEYESKAKEITKQIKTIFDNYRAEAKQEYDAIVLRAKQDSQKLLEERRARVSVEYAEAQQRMKNEVPNLAQAINKKLLSKG